MPPTNEEIMEYQRTLDDAIDGIEGLRGCNPHYSYRLARACLRTGKRPVDLTLGELATILERETTSYNQTFYPNHPAITQ